MMARVIDVSIVLTYTQLNMLINPMYILLMIVLTPMLQNVATRPPSSSDGLCTRARTEVGGDCCYLEGDDVLRAQSQRPPQGATSDPVCPVPPLIHEPAPVPAFPPRRRSPLRVHLSAMWYSVTKLSISVHTTWQLAYQYDNERQLLLDRLHCHSNLCNKLGSAHQLYVLVNVCFTLQGQILACVRASVLLCIGELTGICATGYDTLKESIYFGDGRFAPLGPSIMVKIMEGCVVTYVAYMYCEMNCILSSPLSSSCCSMHVESVVPSGIADGIHIQYQRQRSSSHSQYYASPHFVRPTTLTDIGKAQRQRGPRVCTVQATPVITRCIEAPSCEYGGTPEVSVAHYMRPTCNVCESSIEHCQVCPPTRADSYNDRFLHNVYKLDKVPTCKHGNTPEVSVAHSIRPTHKFCGSSVEHCQVCPPARAGIYTDNHAYAVHSNRNMTPGEYGDTPMAPVTHPMQNERKFYEPYVESCQLCLPTRAVSCKASRTQYDYDLYELSTCEYRITPEVSVVQSMQPICDSLKSHTELGQMYPLTSMDSDNDSYAHLIQNLYEYDNP